MTVIQFSFYFLVCLNICLASTSCPGEAEMRQLAEANNKLAISLYHQLASQSSENIFFSPMSLLTCFGMLYLGTKGETAKELRKILGFEAAGLTGKLVHPTFRRYLTQILSSKDPNAYTLTYANSALLDRNLDVHASYKKRIENYYKASVKKFNFKTENSKAVQHINKWVKDKTNGKIDKLLDDLDPTTVFVLLNAVYFKGNWKTIFEKSKTKPEKFYNNGLPSDAKEVPMMKLEATFPYMTDYKLKLTVLEMPYKGGNISMFVLLPYEMKGLDQKSFKRNLSFETLKSILSRLRENELILKLPKFKVEYSKEMSNDFRALGAKRIFSPGADLSGLTKSKGIYVNQVLHKAILEVNEEGSEAAAVTKIIGPSSEPMEMEMTVNHPFLFAVVDKRNYMILFLGRVNKL